MAETQKLETSVGSEYMFSRGFRDSARLHLQHWIWKEHLAYLLHPTIPRTGESWRVADVGTGNGCWLLDLSQQVPASWSLEGFDVSPKQYPAAEILPSNVTLHTQDAFAEIPKYLHGSFDIVHIRAFAAVVKNGNPDALLENLIRMLKPGGYLQWDEFDSATFSAHSPSSAASKENADEIIRVWAGFAKNLSLGLEWMGPGAMRKNFEKYGLGIVNDTHADRWDKPETFKPVLRKAYTDNWMMALEEVCFVIIGRGGVAQMSAAEFAALLDRTVEETVRGVSLWIDLQVVVGRKAAHD